MIHIEKFTFNPFQENTYVLWDDSKKAVIIDPGCYTSHEENELSEFFSSKNLTPTSLINTHGHIDHVLGNDFIWRKYKMAPWIHKDDLPILKSIKQYGEAWGIKASPSPDPEGYLEEGNQVNVGNERLRILHVPGHSPGHIVLVNEDQKFLIGGDVLFLGSIGRTDLPLGNHDLLIQSIHDKLMSMDEDMKVYPGHGPSTTIGFEKKNNPFLSLDDR